MSQRETALRSGIARGSVSKVMGRAAPPGHPRPATRMRPKLDAHAELIDDIPKSDFTAPKTQRHTIRRISMRLSDVRGFAVGRAHRDALAKGRADTVAISVRAEEVARHPRSCDSADFVFDPLQRLSPLEMEVGAP